MASTMVHRILVCIFMLVSAAFAAPARTSLSSPFSLSRSLMLTADYANFTTTCENPVLHKSRTGLVSQLSASCVTASGGEGSGNNTTDSHATPLFHNSTIDLNLCIGIDYTTAALTWSIYGKFSNYCKDCHVVGRTSLGCSCSTLNGIKANSTIDLDTGISNANGTLSCQGGIGMNSRK